ncbi:hypothetical protein [Novosphingobium sp. SG707]|uniref:hypothetical protein n=1 Tax=Novosphingobium sp. SG707 TaxID=2586996 RepID=UPI001446612F|nr:hypothetical protein [Novosphingobium sp. SG707]NKJ01626.1 hypothetical protein [Novosphingobium sp. SG707]
MRPFFGRILAPSILALMLANSAHAQTASDGPVLSGAFDTWVGNAYVTPHGLVATTRGASIQTTASATMTMPSGVAMTAGVWTDFNPGYDAIGNATRTVNETDPFVAVTVPVTKRLSLTGKYVAFVGNNLPRTANNVALVASYADGKSGQVFTINPYAVFFYEFDGSSVIGVGKPGNTWDVWLGATPTLKLKKLTLSAPSWITLAPKSFFGRIDDSNLGLVTTGLKAATPLDLGVRAGKWTLYANAQYYHLANDNLVAVKSAINRGDHARDQVQFGIGVSVGF